MLRDILVQINDRGSNNICLDTALELSRNWDKIHIIGVHALRTPEVIFYGTPYDVMGYFPQDVIDQKRQETETTANKLKKSFLDQLSQTDTTCEWRQMEGEESDIISFHARFTDLTIISQPSGHFLNEREFTDSLIMDHGLPIMAVPDIYQTTNLTKNVLIAWNGSPEAANAVKNALPILIIAENVILLTVGSLDQNAISIEDINAHLLRHGIQCTNRKATKPSPEEVILSIAEKEDIGLIVAGAWGHSRIRELIVGGVTKTLFTNQKVPVFFTH